MTQGAATPLPPPKERRRLRESRSLTQAQVAAKVGVTRETVRSWESGRTTPRGRKREAYARLLTELAAPQAARTARRASAPDPEPELVGAATAAAPARRSPSPARPARRRTPPPGDTPVERPGTPTEAFDALYAHCAPYLVRQTYLLTGRRTLARESVERAFQLAWQRWPEVAVDPDPAGWVRAAAYEYAMSPWHRLRRGHRTPEAPPADPEARRLLDALLSLPPAYRRTLLLYDGVGLNLPETAAETEASTPAAANRVLHAREAVAEQLPDLGVPDQLQRRLSELAGSEKLDPPRPGPVRSGGEKRTRFWTRAAIAVTVLIVGATALTVRVAPTKYEPVPAPGAPISGVPPLTGPQRLTDKDRKLQERLRAETSGGPQRLAPAAE
ncbi:helix-turn-helix domain-containing protein [Streptomyces sp. SID5785]|uniref:helix-turn-helix domain-containing protein n=1 Tax=Streptomyces sp. SID5785 TaxID=2690309 RepID=UPI0013610951|nr:helix-turn-helix domain-containing protein [Streptomyces sp. SID5785]MZD05955.1 helix-turn-helix domain-containing protein [Streptomyces sp. SID5785]